MMIEETREEDRAVTQPTSGVTPGRAIVSKRFKRAGRGDDNAARAITKAD